MSEYNPDKWTIVKIVTPKEVIFKVLGSWYGGFADGDSWRMNSGITEVKEFDDYYEIYGASGSVYNCWKGCEGMSLCTSGVFGSLVNSAADHGAIVTRSTIKDIVVLEDE